MVSIDTGISYWDLPFCPISRSLNPLSFVQLDFLASGCPDPIVSSLTTREVSSNGELTL